MKQMTRIVQFAMVTIMMILIQSCTKPDVITDILMTYPQSVSADSVKVFELDDAVPADAMRLGHVSVVDDGLSHKCKYNQVLALARQETARIGGNALHVVEHITPSFRHGTCHQIEGDMLLLGRIDVDSIDFLSYARAALEQEERIYVEDVSRRVPANRVRISGGVAIDPDKMETIYGKSRLRNPWTGLVSYEHFLEGSISWGFTYAHVRGDYSRLGKYQMDFVGPSAGLARRFKNNPNWIFNFNAAFGLAYYNIENFHNNYGFGCSLNGGVDFMLTRNIALGMEAGFMLGTFKKPDEVILDEKEQGFTLGTLHLLGGLRFYF